MSTTIDNSEAAILGRTINPERGDLSREAAESILRLRLSERDTRRLDHLSDKAQDGSLSVDEESELESYRHVGRLLELLKSKARLSIKRASGGG